MSTKRRLCFKQIKAEGELEVGDDPMTFFGVGANSGSDFGMDNKRMIYLFLAYSEPELSYSLSAVSISNSALFAVVKKIKKYYQVTKNVINFEFNELS